MVPLERLFRLEIDFLRRLRTEAAGTTDARALRTSYALQSGYEPLIRAAGQLAPQDVERLHARLMAILSPIFSYSILCITIIIAGAGLDKVFTFPFFECVELLGI